MQQDPYRRRGYQNQLIRALLGAGGIALLAIVAFFLAQGAWNMYSKFSQAAALREAGEARLEQLKREEARAEGKVSELGTARGLEAEVRERYGLARPGEGTIVVVRPEEKEEGKNTEPPWWQRLWHTVFPW